MLCRLFSELLKENHSFIPYCCGTLTVYAAQVVKALEINNCYPFLNVIDVQLLLDVAYICVENRRNIHIHIKTI